VARLISKSPLAGLVPVEVGGLTLSEVETGPVTSVAPFKGKQTAVSKALKAAVGLGMPKVGRMDSKGEARALWAGRGRALVMGVALPDLEGAALTDQTGANAVLRIEGPAVDAVLARLVPLDLRATAFPVGQTARTMVGHMMASVTRVGDAAFEVMVMRSMAQTLVHDIEGAAKAVAARDLV